MVYFTASRRTSATHRPKIVSPTTGMLLESFQILLQIIVPFRGTQFSEVLRHAAFAGRNGHLIVVEKNDETGIHSSRIIQHLIDHTAGQRPVTDDGYHGVVFPFQIAGCRHAQSRRDGIARMSRIEGVIRRFRSASENRSFRPSAGAFRIPHLFPSEVYEHRAICDIPDDLVLRSIEHPVNCDGQLHDSQI